MSYRPGGVDAGEIRAGFESLQRVSSAGEIERLIDDMPVMSTPIFHARLRYELHRQLREYGAPHPHFIQVYDYLFMSLHYRLHRRLVESAPIRAAGRAPSKPVKAFAPPYFLELAAQLGDQLPSVEGATLNPVTDPAAIQAEAEALVGQSITLPNYQPSGGSYWSLILVACASCRRTRLQICAYGIDLSQSPSLVESLRDGSLNNFECLVCSGEICFPLRVWVQDGPGSGDGLAALSCAWRISGSKLIYQVPPGTPKMEQNNYILEVRFDKLLQRLGWHYSQATESENPGETFLSLAIAYTANEASEYIRRMTDPEPAIPLAMEVSTLELTRKLKSGLLPIYDVEDYIRETVRAAGRDWPVVFPEDQLAGSRDPHNFLVLCLTAEAVAEARKLSQAVRAVLAAKTSYGFFSLNEVALAEAALARAGDFLRNVSAKDPDHAAAALSVADARSLLFSYLGRHAEAAQAREQISLSPLMGDESLEVRLTRLQLESQAALSLKLQGKLAEALKIYPRCVTALESMEEEVASSEDDYGHVLVQIWHRLSGDLANWGAILITIGERLEAVHKMHALIASDADPDEVARVMKSAGLEPDDLLVTADAISVLEELFAPGINDKTLFKLGHFLLDRALALSEAGEEWEFAGIQARRLAFLLHHHLGELEAAQEQMRKAIDYSSRVAAHSELTIGHFFFAERAIERGDGAEALNHLLASAREEIRYQVGSGYYAQPKGMRLTLSDAALRTVALGGDARLAIMVAESLKVPTTAATMLSGFPVGQGAPVEHPEQVLLGELLARRESLRIEAGRGPRVEADVSEDLRQIELEIEEKRRAISLRDSRFTRWVDATNLDVSDPRVLLRRLGRLGPRTTLLGVLPIGRSVWTYAVWDDGCILSEQPLPPLDGHPPPDYVSPSESRETWEQEYLEQLAAALLNPLEARLAELEPDDRLIISTSDPLAFVPFSALPYRGRPLCEHVCISQTHGISILESCLDRAENSFESVLCVGNPSRPDRPEISDTHLEVVTVAGLFRESGKQAVSLVWDLATVPSLKAEAGRYDVLHFACHAEVASAPGESSLLLLTPDLNMQDSGDLSEDRILSELPLREGCLVNLAGCQTGVHSNSKVFLLGGLVPSFLIAGAGSVIGSLWDLDDSGAATFQIEFYRLLVTGKSPAESLAETQRACLRGELGPDMRDVSMWAGYALYGVG
jgi:tetratricopeptide (TPR) repeat protein